MRWSLPNQPHKDCHEATEAYYVCRSILAPTQIEQVPRKGQELGGKGWKYPLPQKVWEGKQDLFCFKRFSKKEEGGVAEGRRHVGETWDQTRQLLLRRWSCLLTAAEYIHRFTLALNRVPNVHTNPMAKEVVLTKIYHLSRCKDVSSVCLLSFSSVTNFLGIDIRHAR